MKRKNVEKMFEKYGLRWIKERDVRKNWDEVIEEVRFEARSLEGFLRRRKILEMVFRKGGYLVIQDTSLFVEKMKVNNCVEGMPFWLMESLEIR